MNKKPNIILIHEDHKAYYGHGHLGYGPKIYRPNYQRIAAEGIEFTQAYTACPLCGPARRSILTGLYPHNHGEIKNDSKAKYSNEIYFDKLAEAGYKNYYFGKWHAGRGTALDLGCEGFSVPGYGNPYITKEYTQYVERNDLDFIQVKIQKDFDDPISKHLGIKEGELYKPKFRSHSEYFSAIMKTPNESHESFFLVDLACKKLREIVKREDKQPFHMRVDFWGPHEPYIAPQEYVNKYIPNEIPEHPNFRENFDSKPEFYKNQSGDLISKNNVLIEPNPLPWSEWQKVLAINYAEQTLIDEAAGILLNTLEELGLSQNSIVIWSADHGDALGCHGGHFDKDAYMPQEILRIPLAIRWPEIIPAGVKSNKFVSNLDFSPTFLDIAGKRFSAPIDGVSLCDLFKNQDKKWREEQFCETHGHFTPIVGRVIIGKRYKYIYNEGYLDELYDLKEDPFELNNLINYKNYQDIQKEMRLKLKNWRKKTGDEVNSNMIRGKRLKK